MDSGSITEENSFGGDSDQGEEKDILLNGFCRGGDYIYILGKRDDIQALVRNLYNHDQMARRAEKLNPGEVCSYLWL